MCKFSQVDELMRPDHFYLDPDDKCLFMGEYTARKGPGFSATNQLIANFKKTPDRRGRPEWRYKQQAISHVGMSFATFIGQSAPQLTLVPVPPSKCKIDPAYDDRLLQMLEVCRRHTNGLDVRELVTQTISTPAAHNRDDRPRPDELMAIYRVDATLVAGTRNMIVIVDDMLTTGSHFKAMQGVLRPHLPNQQIVGLFVARRVPDTDIFF